MLRLPLRLIPRSAAVSVRSGLNKGFKWIVGSSTHGCWIGTYETQKQSVIRRFVKTGMKVFDVGANAGFYTLAFARLVGDSGEVWAFEPLAAKADYLLKHRSLNGLGNVHVVQAAVADKPGLAGLRVTADGSMGALDEMAAYHVPTVSLDGLIASGALPEPDLIKMDVEGAESMALAGARQLLERQRVVLFLACHGEEQRRRCFRILRDAGYCIYYLDGRRHISGELESDELYAVPAARDEGDSCRTSTAAPQAPGRGVK